MLYRSLLVLLSEPARGRSQLSAAIALARRLEAHLVGLSASGAAPWPAGIGASLLGADTPTPARIRALGRAESRAVHFRGCCAEAGLLSHEAVVEDGDAAEAAVRLGRCSDLVVIGQADPADPAYGDTRALVEDVVLDNARPTLVLPAAGRIATLGDTVLLAWDDSREAARAVADAMPLLLQARVVHLVHCRTPWNDVLAEPVGTALGAVRRWLAWHGIDARPHEPVTEIDVGAALLSRAARWGIDLIVMGAYGQARWTERVLGGTTQTLLAQTRVPLLMSH